MCVYRRKADVMKRERKIEAPVSEPHFPAGLAERASVPRVTCILTVGVSGGGCYLSRHPIYISIYIGLLHLFHMHPPVFLFLCLAALVVYWPPVGIL